jgi:preprotein translocase subunit SecG
MQIWSTILHAIQLLAALTMIGLVLIQHGKGADMGASFGSGASGSLFGASGSANFLSRSTAACAALFFGCTLALAFMGHDVRGRAAEAGASVLDRAAPAASAPAAAVIPGLAPAGSAPILPAPAAAPAAPAVPAAPTAGGVPAPIPASASK